MSKVHIYGGGTFNYVRNHLALSAIAFGSTAKRLRQLLLLESDLHLTKMADSSSDIVTNDDLDLHLKEILKDKDVKCIIMNAALCDYDGQIGNVESGKYADRLESREGVQEMILSPANKVIGQIKTIRPDIIVVGFKTTANEHDDGIMQYKGQRMDVDAVLINDVVLRKNILLAYDSFVSFSDRDEALICLAEFVQNHIRDESKIKNIRTRGKWKTYSIEVLKSTCRIDAFNQACEILKSEGVEGDYLDGRWSMFHQGIYNVSINTEE